MPTNDDDDAPGEDILRRLALPSVCSFCCEAPPFRFFCLFLFLSFSSLYVDDGEQLESRVMLQGGGTSVEDEAEDGDNDEEAGRER